jgi:hypothetical protein
MDSEKIRFAGESADRVGDDWREAGVSVPAPSARTLPGQLQQT